MGEKRGGRRVSDEVRSKGYEQGVLQDRALAFQQSTVVQCRQRLSPSQLPALGGAEAPQGSRCNVRPVVAAVAAVAAASVAAVAAAAAVADAVVVTAVAVVAAVAAVAVSPIDGAPKRCSHRCGHIPGSCTCTIWVSLWASRSTGTAAGTRNATAAAPGVAAAAKCVLQAQRVAELLHQGLR